MLIALFLIALLTVSGLSVTYIFNEDEPLLWRLSAGSVAGSAIFGLICFLLVCVLSFTPVTVSLSFLLALSPLLLFIRKTNRAKLNADWQKAKGKFEGANLKKSLRLLYYVFFFVLFCLFFERAIIETAGGIFTGASQNYGDLPFHLGAIFSFTEGNNFPPENPSYAFAKFSYPFMADLITASLIKMGADLRNAMLVQNVFLAFSLLVVLERFTFKLTGNRLAGKIAPILMFFSGGLGFLWFFDDYRESTKPFFEFLAQLPKDYTISETFRWGNSLVALFVTQRSLLLGMPLTIIVLHKLWEIFISRRISETGNETPEKNAARRSMPNLYSCFVIGLLAGTLPLIHVHSLAVLFVVGAFLFFCRLDKWREWLTFAAGVAIIAVPELVWAMTGSATRLTEFVGWHFGWDKRANNFIWFWAKNTGIFIPVLIYGIYLIAARRASDSEREPEDAKLLAAERALSEKNFAATVPRPASLLLFSVPFLLFFLISNVVKLAPWEWDNIKVLIYWFVGSLPFVALVLATLWKRDNIMKIVAIGCLSVLTFSGALDVWRTVSQEINYKVFDKDAVAVAAQIKSKIPPNALILNAPTFNSAIVLSGRRSLMRYTGHLQSYGIDYARREQEIKRIYAGETQAEILLKKYDIEYVLISPEEKSSLTVNEEYFHRFPVIAEAGQYRVYKVKN